MNNYDDEYSMPQENIDYGDEFNQRPLRNNVVEKKKKSLYYYASALIVLAMLLIKPSTFVKPGGNVIDNPPDKPIDIVVEEKPSCKAIFVAFSDQLEATLYFTAPEKILSVDVQLWDIKANRQEQSWHLTRDDIESKQYHLPEMMSQFDIYMNHHKDMNKLNSEFPVCQLLVKMKCIENEEEKVIEEKVDFSEELGWSVVIKNGRIRFKSYESEKEFNIIVTDNPEVADIPEDTFVISILSNDQYVNGDRCRIYIDEDKWKDSNGKENIWYYSVLELPYLKKDGPAIVTVSQKLKGYDDIWTTTKTLEP